MKTKQIILYIFVPMATLAILAIYLNLSGEDYLHLWSCPLLEKTGLACPGCGLTRCISSILRFRFIEAIKYNLAIFVLFFVIALWYVKSMYFLIRHNKQIKIEFSTFMSILVFLLAFTVLRNLPFYPFKV